MSRESLSLSLSCGFVTKRKEKKRNNDYLSCDNVPDSCTRNCIPREKRSICAFAYGARFTPNSSFLKTLARR